MVCVFIKDIAMEVGVSATDVSLTFNRKDENMRIGKEMSGKIRQKAKCYGQNNLARGLHIGRSKAIGLIVADCSNLFPANPAFCAQEQTEKHGYRIKLNVSIHTYALKLKTFLMKQLIIPQNVLWQFILFTTLFSAGRPGRATASSGVSASPDQAVPALRNMELVVSGFYGISETIKLNDLPLNLMGSSFGILDDETELSNYIAAYNTEKGACHISGTSYELLPATAYTLTTEDPVIAAGERQTAIRSSIDCPEVPAGNLALPVAINSIAKPLDNKNSTNYNT
ncbi:MAG: hypothetical protein LBG28_14665 [Tannerella sp.]|jgi:hypothetical protein|nr:hypothetical protein [Tannerella sp.]